LADLLGSFVPSNTTVGGFDGGCELQQAAITEDCLLCPHNDPFLYMKWSLAAWHDNGCGGTKERNEWVTQKAANGIANDQTTTSSIPIQIVRTKFHYHYLYCF
jgi:hypothetical protein